MRLASLFLHEFKRELRHALKGESPYLCVLVGQEGELKRILGGIKFARTPLLALMKAGEMESAYVIRRVSAAHQFISIQYLIAKPCRLARSILFHFRDRNEEAKAMRAVLCHQTRQAVMKDINGKGLTLDHAGTPHATPADAMPEHRANDSLALGNVVNGKMHDSYYAASNSQASAKAIQPNFPN